VGMLIPQIRPRGVTTGDKVQIVVYVIVAVVCFVCGVVCMVLAP